MSTSSFQQDTSISQPSQHSIKPTLSDLIIQLKQTNEYNRSKAIADSITFLLSQIKSLESSNSSLTSELTQLSSSLSSLNSNLNHLKTENTHLHNEIKILKSKLSVTDQLNHTLDQTISELNTKLSTQQQSFDSKCDKFSSILSEYKNVFESLKQEKISLDNEIIQLKKDNESLYKDNSILKKEKMKVHSMQKKVKEYELLLYKIDLENQTFRQELKRYQQGETIHNGQCDTIDVINKIDLHNELNVIDNNYKNEYMNDMNVMNDDEYERDRKSNNDNMMINNEDYVDINELKEEIKYTENMLKEYSALLLQKESNNDGRGCSKDFKEIMNVMETQTEKLINLKKQYNKLIKTSIV